jgi:hypothetical protein
MTGSTLLLLFGGSGSVILGFGPTLIVPVVSLAGQPDPLRGPVKALAGQPDSLLAAVTPLAQQPDALRATVKPL